MFVVGANSPSSFDRVKDIVTTMIKMPKDIPTKYGVVKYSADSKIVASFEDYRDHLGLLKIVEDMNWKSEGFDVRGGIDNARKIFEKSKMPVALRRMVVFVDTVSGYNDVNDISKDIEEDGIKLVTVVGDGKDVAPEDVDATIVIDDPTTDVGNTTLPISEQIHKG